MQEQVNLEEITDIKELKVMKSDQYDILEAAQTTLPSTLADSAIGANGNAVHVLMIM